MYSWDEGKRETNNAKHGVDFTAADAFDWQTAMIVDDERFAYGERREIAFGFIGARLHVLVFTRREATHIISLRKANSREIKRYVEALG
ncbi:hypothetical protein SAMN05216548_10716 [Faunimonas pinastri]|uniref:BrnT family toxin n=1 Tax=Faunimonas pinastri TaxID=1855383 RepID=A0A1H9I8C2_9HYPH|nr:BrnT family toxin [Faunimonas pinastri]SEQ70814.1 hypothetical protein SAMN05216548_10716 [Faunimonas pinastri]